MSVRPKLSHADDVKDQVDFFCRIFGAETDVNVPTKAHEMEAKLLTKSQRRRANEKRRKEAARHWDETMGAMPLASAPIVAVLGRNIEPFEKQDAFEKAPSYLVDFDEDGPSLNKEKLARVSQNAAETQTEERDQRIADLKVKYARHWGKRGGAAIIARAEAKNGDPISVRTVRDYFKRTRK